VLPVRVESPALPRARRQTLPRPLRLARLALLVAVAATTFAVSSGLAGHGGEAVAAPAPIGRLVPALTSPFASPAALLADRVDHGAPALGVLAPPPLPTPVTIATDRAGSSIARITYPSAALGWRDSFLVYLPPGYRSSTSRYPVLYLLHGDRQGASSFLHLGLAQTLDRLIAAHTIRPLIAVMLQAGGLPNNWRDAGDRRYNAYVGEVTRMTDRVLRTIPDRAARGIAGYSMGGFGAMNVALTNLHEYSVVESWEGYFDNLSARLVADRPLLARMPLRAFVYGGSQDTVASPSENAPWAAALRSAGAQAESAVYPGGHAFAPLRQHLAAALTFAGRALRS